MLSILSWNILHDSIIECQEELSNSLCYLVIKIKKNGFFKELSKMLF